jgi:hypothetical protein
MQAGRRKTDANMKSLRFSDNHIKETVWKADHPFAIFEEYSVFVNLGFCQIVS